MLALPSSPQQSIRTSQIFLPMDDASVYSTSTPSTEDEHRWSDIVSPKAALTFAALWDPDEGMITFSGARLLESDTNPNPDAPHSDVSGGDTASQTTSSEPTAEGVAPLSSLHGAFRTFLYRVPSRSLRYREPRALTRTSSAVDTKDTPKREVPLRSSRSLHTPRSSRVDPGTPQSVRTFKSRTERIPEACGLEEQSVTGKRGHLTSRFSTATTYVESPPVRTPKDKGPTGAPSSPSQSPPRRRLRKRRPDSESHKTIATQAELPKSGAEGRNLFFLLSRSPSSRPLSRTKSGSIKYRLPGFPRRTSSLRSTASDEGWVYIEVQTSIQQLYVPDPGDD